MDQNLPARVRRQHDAELRRRGQELDYIDHQVERAEAQVAGVNRVGQRAMIETMQTALLRREAERLVPDAAELYSMISIATAIQSVHVIDTMYRRH